MAGRNTRSAMSGRPGQGFISQRNQQGTDYNQDSYSYEKNRSYPNPYNRTSDNRQAPQSNQNYEVAQTLKTKENENQNYNRPVGNNQARNVQDIKPAIKMLQQQAENINEPIEQSDLSLQDDASVKSEDGDTDGKKTNPWKKGNLHKVKLSNSERRGRQNKRLRKLLTPKNALMVLNELQGSQIPEYKLGQTVVQPYMGANQYKAEVVVNGSTYQGQGISKILAKNNAAEKAIRDLVLERMRNEKTKEAAKETMDGEDVVMTDTTDKANEKESQIPMLHLASYALHKLFTEWQAEGYEIPLLTKNLSTSATNLTEMKVEGSESPVAKKVPKQKTELPANAGDLHPAMLLSQMRPGTQYSDISAEGTAPNNIVFTIGVTVDGQQFLGSAKNKKEARRQAALLACTSVFGVQYPAETTTENVVLPIASVV